MSYDFIGLKHKIWITAILGIAVIVTGTSFYIYLTPPGLHYLVIAYDAALLIVLALVSYFITRNYPLIWISPYLLFIIGLLTFLIAAMGSNTIVGIGVCAVSILIIVGLIFLVWQSDLSVKLQQKFK